MINRKRKQRRSIIIAILIMIITGCGNSIGKDDLSGYVESDILVDKNDMIDQEAEALWNVEYLEIPKNYSYMVIGVEEIYGSYSEEGQSYIECLSKETGLVEKNILIPEVACINFFHINKEGGFDIIGQKDGKEILVRISDSGNVEEITSYILEDLESVSRNNGYIPKGVFTDSEGYHYIWYEMYILASEVGRDYGIENVYTKINRVYVKDKELNTIFYEQVTKGVKDFRVDEEGTPLFFLMDGEEVYQQKLDVDNKRLDEITAVEWSQDIKIYNKVFQMEDGFCFKQASGSEVWKYDYAKQECEVLIDFLKYGIDPYYIVDMRGQNDIVEMIYINTYTQGLEYIVLKDEQVDKQTITLGTTWVSEELSRAVSYFNGHNDKLQIQIITYWNGEGTYEEAIEKLKLDIVSGKAPDIIEVSDAYMSILVEKGVFSDLYGFMKEDTECQKEMLLNPILKLYEKDGHLYNIAPTFYLYSMWGNSAVVQGRYGISLKELQDLLAYNDKDMSAIYGFYASTPVLTTLCTFGMDELIDWEKRTCDFEGRYFKDILNFAKEYEEARLEDSMEYDIISTRVKRGEILLSGGMLCSVADYQIQKEIFGGELEVIGYPTYEGSGTAAGFWGSQLAINAASKHQEESWKFVKSYLLNSHNGMGFPLVKEQFEQVMHSAMEKEYTLSEDGVTKLEVTKGGFSAADIYVYEASQEDVETVRWMVENASQRMQRYKEIQDIIDEEAQAYLSGQKSLEDTTRIIQNRVTLYLEEHM